MLAHGLSRKVLGCLSALLLIMSMSGCGGGSGSAPAGTSPVAPITGDSAVIEARTAGGIMAAKVNEVVALDGTKSVFSSNTPEFISTNTVLSYSWSFSSIPEGSSAELQNPTTSNPSFTADVAGDYLVQLVVSARGYTSKRAVQLIVVTEASDKNIVGPYSGHLGVSSNCVQCHDGVKTYNKNGVLTPITPMPVDHIGSSRFCQACHTTRGFAIAVKTDHEEVFGSCSGCHDNVTAVGLSEFHSPIESDCNACHNTVSFLTLEADGSYNHSNITRACQGCHNGKVARGTVDTPIHQPPLSDCGFCHTTASFKGAFPDHTGPQVVGKRCDSCHNDDPTNGIGKSSTGFHPADMSVAGDNSLDCDTCHSITEFNMGGFFDHSLIDITLDPQEPACFKCHYDSSTNIGATQMPNDANHSGLTIDQNMDCNICHSTEAFAGATFYDHSVLAPGKLCADCHGDLAPVNAGDIDATGIPATTATYQHVDTNGADCGACHTPGTFATGVFDHSTIGASKCDSCHDDVIATGMASFDNHVPLDSTAPADCDVCHNPSHAANGYETFASTTAFPVNMVHNDPGVDIEICASCHNGTISTGKSTGHVPTRSLDCDDCHVNTLNYTDFALSPWDHAAIIGAGLDTDCASCHAAGYATGKSDPHIPSVNECSVCHTNTAVGGFATNNFRNAVHDAYTTGCEGCHVSTYFPDNAVAYKAASHLPTEQDCYFCHTASAANFMDYSSFAHTGITNNCASCHDGSFVSVLPNAKGEPNDNLHNTITADCSICHTTVNGFLDGAYVDHTSLDILNVRCDNCHNGDFTFNTAPAPVIKGKNFISNHPTTSSDCIVCHSSDPAADFKDGGVDHSSAAVQAQRCDACHNGTDAIGLADHASHVPIPAITIYDDCDGCHTAGASFTPATFWVAGQGHDAELQDNCESCHDGNYETEGANGALGKNVGHVATNADCSSCHNTSAFAGAVFDHSTVVGEPCASCHSVASDGSHIPYSTGFDCAACHTTAAFKPASNYDHSQNPSSIRCDTCHDDQTYAASATQKTSNHISTNADCGTCHFGFDTFAGATFDHSGVSASTRCDSCHVEGSATATGKDDAVPTHLVTTLDCRSCHAASAGTFAGGSWTHDASAAGNCTNCHDNGGGATEQSSGHIATSIQCDECHSTNDWTFSHTSSNYPGPHRTSYIPTNRCDMCHSASFPRKNSANTFVFTNSVYPVSGAFPWQASTYAPYCAGCHAKDFESESKHIGGRNGTVEQNKNCGAGGCHGANGGRNF